MSIVVDRRSRRHEYVSDWLRRFIADHSDRWDDLVVEILYRADTECGQRLAVGRNDAFCSVAALRPVWDGHVEPWTDPSWTAEVRDELFSAAMERLVAQGDIVRVSDRQRVRTRTFETVHYLRNLRQRLDGKSAIADAPGLVEMVKAETVRRQRPQRMASLDALCDAVSDAMYADGIPPLAEHIENFDRIASIALDIFRSAVTKVLSANSTFSGFQVRATRELLRAILGKEEAWAGVAIAAGTGFGKTEAFAFPAIYYSIVARVVQSISERQGVSAILLYPRRDLCDDQAGRLSATSWL